MTTTVDAKARAAALNIEGSFCVSAPAGSGKTELLTQRFLKLLAQVENPEQIQAITFTRKAAAEMRERIVQALKAGKKSEPPTQSHRLLSWQLARQALQQSAKNDWQLIDNPQRLRIQTIDSLCHNIARDQPVLSQIGGSLQPVDDAKPLYEAAIDGLFAELEGNPEVAADISVLLYHLDNNARRLKELFMQMLPIRDQWLPGVNFVRQDKNIDNLLDQTLKKWIAEELGHVRTALSHAAADLILCADFAATFLVKNPDISPNSPIRLLAGLTQLPEALPQNHEQWLGLVSLLITNDFKPRKKLDKRQGFPAKSDKKWGEQSQHFKQQLSDIIETISSDEDAIYRLKTIVMLPTSGYSDSEKPLLGALTNCLLQLCGQLELVFGAKQQCDHNEIAIRALRALGAQNGDTVASATAYKWSQQLKHLLVDEFQDTSERQFELLEALTDDWPQHNVLNDSLPNTLFIVGDGMQSIYSFREAKVGLFLQAKTQGIGGLKLEPIDLQQNFRSTSALVNWVNQHFSKAFPAHMDRSQGAVPYSASVSFEPETDEANTSSAVEVVACIKNAEPDAAVMAEATYIVAEIKAVYEEDRAAEIAILVRARSHLTAILPALDEAGIRWQGVDIDPLERREVIMDCMTLVRALINPADNIAWYALLRAPFCGLTLSDLQAVKDCLAQEKAHGRLANYICADATSELAALNTVLEAKMSADGWQRLQHLCKIMTIAWRSRAKNSVRHWIESTWLALGGQYMAIRSAGGDDRRSAEAFFDLLESLEQNQAANGTFVDINLLSSKVESLYAKSPVVTNDVTPAVQILTMHKAKGLEYDVVFLPGLQSGSVSSTKPLLITHTRIFDDGRVGLALSPMQKPSDALIRDKHKSASIYEFLLEQEKRLKSYELQRLLYVAATRARRKLVLLAVLDELPDGELKAPSKGSLLAPLWQTLKSEARRIYPDNKDEPVAQADIEYLPLRRFKLDTLLWLESAQHENSATNASGDNFGEMVDTANESDNIEASESTRILGLCAHEIFEQVTKLGINYWRKKSLAELKPHWSIRLAELGMQDDQIAAAVDTIALALTRVLASTNGEMLFSATHKDVRTEWALSAFEDEQVQRWVLDLSFVDMSNNRWVVDYKMAKPGSGQSLSVFLKQQENQYAEKMLQYQKAVERYDNVHQPQVTATRCALYFPIVDELLEINA